MQDIWIFIALFFQYVGQFAIFQNKKLKWKRTQERDGEITGGDVAWLEELRKNTISEC